MEAPISGITRLQQKPSAARLSAPIFLYLAVEIVQVNPRLAHAVNGWKQDGSLTLPRLQEQHRASSDSLAQPGH